MSKYYGALAKLLIFATVLATFFVISNGLNYLNAVGLIILAAASSIYYRRYYYSLKTKN